MDRLVDPRRGSLNHHILMESKFVNSDGEGGGGPTKTQNLDSGVGRLSWVFGLSDPKSPKTGRGGVACGHTLRRVLSAQNM